MRAAVPRSGRWHGRRGGGSTARQCLRGLVPLPMTAVQSAVLVSQSSVGKSYEGRAIVAELTLGAMQTVPEVHTVMPFNGRGV